MVSEESDDQHGEVFDSAHLQSLERATDPPHTCLPCPSKMPAIRSPADKQQLTAACAAASACWCWLLSDPAAALDKRRITGYLRGTQADEAIASTRTVFDVLVPRSSASLSRL